LTKQPRKRAEEDDFVISATNLEDAMARLAL